MLLDTRIFRQGKWWVGEVTVLNISTQGHSKKELLSMLKDLVQNLFSSRKPSVMVFEIKGEVFLEVRPFKLLLPAILKRQRIKAGMTVRQVAERMGYKNHHNYAAYESGKIVPSFEKFQELMAGLFSRKAPKHDLVALRLVV